MYACAYDIVSMHAYDSDLSILCACPCKPLGTHLATRLAASDNPEFTCLDPNSLDCDGLPIDQSA